MKTEDKELLLKDLCARLPYQVKVSVNGGKESWTLKGMFEGEHTGMMLILEPSFPSKDVAPQTSNWQLSQCKPYLRPMSSMTEEEKKEFKEIFKGFFQYFNGSIISDSRIYDRNEAVFVGEEICGGLIDWLNKKMFDFRGLIPIGAAIEITENNNLYKD